MKNLITAVTLATLVSSPVFAQSYDPDMGTGNIAPAPYAQTANGASAFAQARAARSCLAVKCRH